MGDSTSSYATAGIALRVSGALKPHHHDKVDTLLVGKICFTLMKYCIYIYIALATYHLKMCSGNVEFLNCGRSSGHGGEGLGFITDRVFLDQLSKVSFSRRTLLHGIK
jgi:hypothetical protein